MKLFVFLIITITPFSNKINNLCGQPTDFQQLSGQVSFSVKIEDEICRNKIYSLFVLPEEELNIELINDTTSLYQINADVGSIISTSATELSWQAPAQKGVYTLTFTKNGEEMVVNVFVMIPYKELKDGYLNGYKIGNYPSNSLNKKEIYQPPKGFIEITKENKDLYISPHFQLSQFLCKQNSSYPKYIVLKEKLLLKLELLIDDIVQKGYSPKRFKIMSAYRTPYYNQSLGNTKFSRHVWGDAVDICIDSDPKNNNRADSDIHAQNIKHLDIDVIYKVVDNFHIQKAYKNYLGGLGRYPKNANHDSFVHVDVRGYLAKWGD